MHITKSITGISYVEEKERINVTEYAKINHVNA